MVTEHRYTMVIEQWGSHKWHGNILHQWRGMFEGHHFSNWSIGSEYEFGWSARSREKLERKLRRVIKRERKRNEFRDQPAGREIVA